MWTNEWRYMWVDTWEKVPTLVALLEFSGSFLSFGQQDTTIFVREAMAKPTYRYSLDLGV